MRWFGRARATKPVDDDRSPTFRALVSGKRVAVVGPAMTLVGTGSGARIDACDLVVRFNEVFEHLPIGTGRQPDFGARCDVVYANQVVLRRNLVDHARSDRQAILSRSADCGLKYLVCTNNSLSYAADGRPLARCPPSDRRTPVAVVEALREASSRVQLRVVRDASERAIDLLAGFYGRTGFVGILDLLGCGVSELFVTGMSFYHGGGHVLAPTGPPLHPRANRDGSPAVDGERGGHDSTRELAVFRSLVAAYPSTVRVDEPLAKLLHYGPDLDERSQH